MWVSDYGRKIRYGGRWVGAMFHFLLSSLQWRRETVLVLTVKLRYHRGWDTVI